MTETQWLVGAGSFMIVTSILFPLGVYGMLLATASGRRGAAVSRAARAGLDAPAVAMREAQLVAQEQRVAASLRRWRRWNILLLIAAVLVVLSQSLLLAYVAALISAGLTVPIVRLEWQRTTLFLERDALWLYRFRLDEPQFVPPPTPAR